MRTGHPYQTWSESFCVRKSFVLDFVPLLKVGQPAVWDVLTLGLFCLGESSRTLPYFHTQFSFYIPAQPVPVESSQCMSCAPDSPSGTFTQALVTDSEDVCAALCVSWCARMMHLLMDLIFFSFVEVTYHIQSWFFSQEFCTCDFTILKSVNSLVFKGKTCLHLLHIIYYFLISCISLFSNLLSAPPWGKD